MATIVNWERAAQVRREAQQERRTVVFTNGVFDVLHVGHIRTLRLARKQGSVLIVGVNTDESVRALKGPYRPMNPLAARLEMLEALDIIDYLLPFGTATEPSVEPVIEALQPDVLVKGGDYSPDGVVGAAVVEQHGGRIVIAPKAAGVSTSATIEKLQGARKGQAIEPWVFVDLDGVLVDFFGSMARALGRHWDPDECRGEYDPGKMFGCRTDLFSVFGPDFWETADWMRDGPDVLLRIQLLFKSERIILCSSPTLETASPMGKLLWIERQLPCFVRQYIFTPVKAALVSPGAIILDDHDDQINACLKEIMKRHINDCHPILVPRPWNSLWQKAKGLDVAAWIQGELEAILAEMEA